MDTLPKSPVVNSPSPTGNTVELRTIGKNKWLFVNGVHIAGVQVSKLTDSVNERTKVSIEFYVDHIIGFDR